MREQKPERMWAIATGVNERSGQRYPLAHTIRRTKREAIAAYGEWLGGRSAYALDRKRDGVAAVRVLVTIEDAPQGAPTEE